MSEEGGQGRKARTDDGGLLSRCKNFTFPLSGWEATGGLGAQEWQDLTNI